MARPEPGSLVAHYRLERRLGAGGMGEVFLGWDTELKRQVAIKFLTKSDDASHRHRLMREARAIAAIDHPAICAIHEVASDAEAGDFIVMQYLPGETLAARLARGRMPRDAALRLAAQLAEALQVAHQAGVVHRDLKPQNIMLGNDDAPRLLDFGIAQRLPDAADLGDATTETSAIDSLPFAGTPAYMAPEQIAGRAADARTDLFALGCVLYECFTGRRAFTGASSREVLDAVLHASAPPPSSAAPGLWPADDALCARLLAKDPGERFQTARAVSDAIAALQPTGVSAQRTDPEEPSGLLDFIRRRPFLSSLTAALALSLAGWLWLVRPAAAPAPEAARRDFEQGLEKLRQGSYASAGRLFEAAIEIFPEYVLAHARLAETRTELDDLLGASLELNRVHALVQAGARLARDDQLRLDAVQASVERNHEKAIAAYEALKNQQSDDAARWIDLGRVYEAAAEIVKARDAYARAAEIDPHLGAARLRLGAMQVLDLDLKAAESSFGSAEREFKFRTNPEGQAEVGYRRALLLLMTDRNQEALPAIEDVIAQCDQYGFTFLETRARFLRARILYAAGRSKDAAEVARAAVDDASNLGLKALAAEGLIDLAVAIAHIDPPTAESHLRRAFAFAKERGSQRTERRAELQLADLMRERGQAPEALARAEEARSFFAEKRFLRNAAEALLIMARAHDTLGDLEAALKLATELADIARTRQDNDLKVKAELELQTVRQKRGFHPAALAGREEIEGLLTRPIDRAYNATDRAETLIILGRNDDARRLLDQIQSAIDNQNPGYEDRQPRVVMLRALLFTSLRQHSNVLALEAPASMASKPDTALQFHALVEHARAQSGRRSAAADDEVAAWPDKTTDVYLGYELAFCAASTLAARQSWQKAHDVSTAALEKLTSPQSNLEVRWRLAAVAALAAKNIGLGDEARARASSAAADFNQLSTGWGKEAQDYRARADLAVWRKIAEGGAE